MISHWDEIPEARRERGHIAGAWQSLTGDATVQTGVNRIQVDPGRFSTPLHVEGSEEEIFYVLAGSGVAVVSDDGTARAVEVRPGDVLVHLALRHGHTLRAGEDGLDVLAFGERHWPWGSTRLPRAGVSWGLGAWVRTGVEDEHPWTLEAAAGPPEVGELTPREEWPWLVASADVPFEERVGATVGRRRSDLGRAAGSQRTGVKLYEALPGMLSCPPHCHSEEEEIFVVTGGEGLLELYGPDGMEETPLRVGSVVARPAGTGVAHAFRGGPDAPLRFLAYGTRAPGDVAYYPRSRKVSLRGLGVILRLGEPVDYWEGED